MQTTMAPKALASSTSLRAGRPVAQKAAAARMAGRRSMVVRADGFIGSSENLIMATSTTLFLVAGRFGLAPTANRHTTAGLKLYDDKSAGLVSNDPSGFTAVDVLALGAFGHIIGAGVILGLRATGGL